MAKKGNQHKKGSMGLSNRASNHTPSPPTAKDIDLKNECSSNLNEEDGGFGDELPNGSTKGVTGIDHVQDSKNMKKKSKKYQRKEKKREEKKDSSDNIEMDLTDMPTGEGLSTKDRTEFPNHLNSENINCSEFFSNGLHNEEVVYPETLVFKFLRNVAIYVARSCAGWVERHQPTYVGLKCNVLKARDHVRMKIQRVQPIVVRWVVRLGNVVLLLFMVWLDCSLRGIDSFLRMGTTSFFSIVWCTLLSVIAMAGLGKSLVALAVIAVCGVFLGITYAALVGGLFAILLVWFYGSLWTTWLIVVLGGLALITNHDRIALFIAITYSIHCVWTYVGWLGLLLGLNLSFISSDVLLFVLKNVANDQRAANGSSEQTSGFRSQPSFSTNEHFSPGIGAADVRVDRRPGTPSTSSSDVEIASEDEIVRLLSCKDHYDALGVSRFGNIDPLVIKREYRKKAMRVHPDKNMGNEKAAEAFQKLQNAYEVLLDATKRKEYDDELKKEELLSYFRKLQQSSPENRRYGIFRSGPETDGENPLGESRQIVCKKCGFSHIWMSTKKIKSKARWCQDCKDFHLAKDGDGWVEQSSQPVFFGMLQQVEAPCAFVCAGGKVYDATEWYICQGMRCPANTHKPAFQVNTNVMGSKNSHTKGPSPSTSGQKMPAHNPDETMTEEEFYEWLQNAVQSGAFDNSATAESSTKSGGGGGSNGGGKRKKKGKKQW